MDTSPYLLWRCVQNDSADSWLINSWITIWQSPIILYSAFLHCAGPLLLTILTRIAHN